MKRSLLRRKYIPLIFSLLCLSLTSAHAQITTNTPWVWMHGDDVGDQYGVYGTKGTPAPANNPGSRNTALSWSTPDGNLWLLGGYGNSSSANGRLNDLWKYTPSADEWTWVKGDDNTDLNGVYGTLGVPATTNKPGARSSGATWTDTAGNLWLFGGFGYAASQSNNQFLNDLWKYNPATGQWTWIKGDSVAGQNGKYGTKGVAAANNNPGSRWNAVFWQDNAGNFWLFGGSGFDAAGGDGYLNDLWKYNMATNQWTWVSGDNVINATGIYGVLGTPAATNKPGARGWSSGWTDTTGNLWLFGGEYQSSYFNDLWRFNPKTNVWTWIKGANTMGANGVYGTKGTSSALNTPGSRKAAAAWADNQGNFWLLGGLGFAASGSEDFLNDFWKYDPAANEWVWVKGESATDAFGTYGTKGSEDPANMPGARSLPAFWTDSRGEFWLFGGDGFGKEGRTATLNDLWKLKNCIQLQQPDKIDGDDIICAYSSQTYTITPVTGASSYTWFIPTGWTGSSTGNSITVTLGNTGGTISAVANGICDTSDAKTLAVRIFPVPEAVISVDGFDLSTSTPYAEYQWFLNGNMIAGATNNILTVTVNGDYMVAVVDSNGCKDTSDVYKVTNATGLQDVTAITEQIKIYPNPVRDLLYIKAPLSVNVILTTLEGKVLNQLQDARYINVKNLSEGMYLLRIQDEKGNLIKVDKFIKVK